MSGWSTTRAWPASTAVMIAEFGYEVTEASSAEQTLDLVRRGAVFDLLVTAISWPG